MCAQKETRDKDKLKSRVKKWMGVNETHKQRDALDIAILETFFYIYNGLEDGMTTHEIGSELGVLPFP